MMKLADKDRAKRGVTLRPPQWIGVAAAAVLLAGCGDRHLVLKVDVLSYLDPNITNVAFGPVPAIPGGLETGEQDVVKDASVNMVAGTDNIAKVQSVSIAMKIAAYDSTGSGADTMRVYMSDVNTDPTSTPAVMEIPLALNPGMADTVAVDVGGDSRVADLFAGKQLRVTITTSLRGPDSGPDLYGRVKMLGLDAVLVAARKSKI